jgi:quinoprotein glucose dehydrogenase
MLKKLRACFRTGELRLDEGNSGGKQAAFEATPLMVAGTLYFSTPSDRVFALDPGSGVLKWQYDPHIDMKQHFSETTSRGVALWSALASCAGVRIPSPVQPTTPAMQPGTRAKATNQELPTPGQSFRQMLNAT